MCRNYIFYMINLIKFLNSIYNLGRDTSRNNKVLIINNKLHSTSLINNNTVDWSPCCCDQRDV